MTNKHMLALGLAASLVLVACSSGESAAESATRNTAYTLDDDGTVVPIEPAESRDQVDADEAQNEVENATGK